MLYFNNIICCCCWEIKIEENEEKFSRRESSRKILIFFPRVDLRPLVVIFPWSCEHTVRSHGILHVEGKWKGKKSRKFSSMPHFCMCICLLYFSHRFYSCKSWKFSSIFFVVVFILSLTTKNIWLKIHDQLLLIFSIVHSSPIVRGGGTN